MNREELQAQIDALQEQLDELGEEEPEVSTPEPVVIEAPAQAEVPSYFTPEYEARIRAAKSGDEVARINQEARLNAQRQAEEQARKATRDPLEVINSLEYQNALKGANSLDEVAEVARRFGVGK